MPSTIKRLKIKNPERVRLQKSHKVGIGIFVFVKILLIIAVIYLAYTLTVVKTDLQGKINDLETELAAEIETNKRSSQLQINELRNNFLSTQEEFSLEISKLQAKGGDDFSGIIQEVIPGVVSISTDVAQGSGFIISEHGHVITNSHVLSGGSYAQVLIYETTRLKDASLIGYDEELDIAILKISGDYEEEFLTFANSDDLEVGERAIAIGNPLGLSFTVTEGIISALNREGANNIEAYIQIDTPLNSGNSGGPLISDEGEVIGVNNFKIRGGEGLGFALESNFARATANKILRDANETINGGTEIFQI
tara:strand:- start:9799 stop:10725 length:927 start_codon:yes stop_codon:yes gene_type:complete